MIGVTDDPEASGVNIAGWAVWKPESLAPAPADPASAAAAAQAAKAANTTLSGFRICVSSPR
jgi:hypothetical protein